MTTLPGSLLPSLRRGLRHLVDFALPWQCTICFRQDERANESFCVNCLQQLTSTGNPCRRCGAIVGPFATTAGNCPHCRRRPFRFRSARCLNMYDEALRTVIVRSKQSFSSAAMRGVGQLLVSQRRQWLTEQAVDRILPIPQPWLTRLTRNFNPADVIGRSVGQALGIRVDPHILRRRRGWQLPQKKVPLARRYENQKNAFRLRDAHLIRGQCVLLVDDVLTTGATCSEAARLLKAAGAKDVHVLVAARVADH